MHARSTNPLGFIHIGGDIVSGVNDGIGIVLGSASTGATAWIEPLSDSDTAALGIRAKGAAKLTIGNSSNTVNLVAPALGAASTTYITLVQKYTVQVAPPDLAASTSVNSTYAVTGLTTNSVIVLTPRMPVNPVYNFRARCSTADELVITWQNTSGSTQSDSTNRMTVLSFGF